MSDVIPYQLSFDCGQELPLTFTRIKPMDEPQALSLPTPEQFDAGYDGTTAFLLAFRTTSLYALLRNLATRPAADPMERIEVTDEMVDEFAKQLEACDVAAGLPAQRRDRPFLRDAIQQLIEALRASLAGSGGLGGIFGALIKQWLDGMLNPTT
jgi:hypothetical protein